MSNNFDHLTFRPIIGPQELQLFCQLPYVLNFELEEDLAAGRRLPEWMWMALDGDRILARIAWWGRSGDVVPSALDIFDVDDSDRNIDHVELCFRLLEVATAAVLPGDSRRPEYGRFVPPDWRDHIETSETVDVRMAALERSGARLLVERLRFEWSYGTPIAASSNRLTFRSPHDDEEIVDLMASALEGTLDVHSQQDLAVMSARGASIRHFEGELAQYRSPRDWWKVATLPAGNPVGFVFPARNDYHAIIAYIGILPLHRGRGYIDDVLAEGMRTLIAQEVPHIRASTDLGNVPMADAFKRAGWINFERSIDMTW